jgi:PAS domain S-box-containing protein
MACTPPPFADLESLPVQVWTARPDGMLDYVNACVADYFGVTRERVLEHGWKDLCHPFDLIAATAAWASSLETDTPYEIHFRLLRGSDRQFRWHVGRALPRLAQDGRVLGWIGSNVDIDDIRRGAEVDQALASQLRVELQASRRSPSASG